MYHTEKPIPLATLPRQPECNEVFYFNQSYKASKGAFGEVPEQVKRKYAWPGEKVSGSAFFACVCMCEIVHVYMVYECSCVCM